MLYTDFVKQGLKLLTTAIIFVSSYPVVLNDPRLTDTVFMSPVLGSVPLFSNIFIATLVNVLVTAITLIIPFLVYDKSITFFIVCQGGVRGVVLQRGIYYLWGYSQGYSKLFTFHYKSFLDFFT